MLSQSDTAPPSAAAEGRASGSRGPAVAAAAAAAAKAPKPPAPKAPFLSLYSHADAWDVVALTVGAVAALANGATLPAFAFIFGEVCAPPSPHPIPTMYILLCNTEPTGPAFVHPTGGVLIMDGRHAKCPIMPDERRLHAVCGCAVGEGRHCGGAEGCTTHGVSWHGNPCSHDPGGRTLQMVRCA